MQQSQLFQAAPHRGQGLPNPRVGMLQKSTADCERAPHIAEKKELNKRCTMSLLEASDCESFLAFQHNLRDLVARSAGQYYWYQFHERTEQ